MASNDAIVRCVHRRRYTRLVSRFTSPLTEHDAPAATSDAVAALSEYPAGFTGRGIVVPGGGFRYFASAWVCIRMLREVGCTLPIELWHVGADELDEEMRSLVTPLGVRCVDAAVVAKRWPVRFLSGWSIKPFALMFSSFEEALLLDADNMTLRDPSYLYEAPEYRQTGAVFWPDDTQIPRQSRVWDLVGVPYRPEPEFESGQMLVDKARCWRALELTVWMNNVQGDFWYRHVYGDKDTFHLAWRRLGIPYAMPPHEVRILPDALVQFDFQGRPLFQHRYGNKWEFETQMLHIAGFDREDQCRQLLSELRGRWKGRPNRPYRQEDSPMVTRAIAESLCARTWCLRSADGDSREISFGRDGTIRGGTNREVEWSVHVHPYNALLSISGEDSVAWLLARAADHWMGQAPAQPERWVELRPAIPRA